MNTGVGSLSLLWGSSDPGIEQGLLHFQFLYSCVNGKPFKELVKLKK